LWKKQESPRKPHGEVRELVNLNAEDPEKKPLWAYEERVRERLRWIHADGHGQQYLYWPQGKIKEGEDAKSRKELYQANFSATGAGRYPKSLSQRRWKRLQKGKKYRLGLNTFGSVRTIKPPRPAAARPAATPQAPPTGATQRPTESSSHAVPRQGKVQRDGIAAGESSAPGT
jgi:hypothetical protein